MPFFQGMHHADISQSVLIDIRGNYNHSSSPVDHGIEALIRATAVEAFHSSYERFPPPKCHPNTRIAVISQIKNWIATGRDYPRKSKKVFWLYGPAGAGKSAIAQSICKICHEDGTLAASFFFSPGKDRRGAAKYLFATLAYQICIVIPELQDEIRQALNNDPTILDQSLEIQIQKLLVKPYHSIMHSGTPNVLLSQHPFLIIIDGLDECHGDQMHCTILAYITALVATHGLPFFFLIASRPEPHIRHEFNCNMVLSNISITSPLDCSDTDIRVFLENGFHIIRAQYRAHTLSTISETWPSPEDIDALVQRSSGYFIYPATVLKFIDQPDTRPQAQLRLVLSNNLTSFTELDQLYHQIMSTVPDTQSLLLILGLIVVDTDNYFRPSQRSNVVLAHLLSLDEGDIRLTLRRMHPPIDDP